MGVVTGTIGRGNATGASAGRQGVATPLPPNIQADLDNLTAAVSQLVSDQTVRADAQAAADQAAAALTAANTAVQTDSTAVSAAITQLQTDLAALSLMGTPAAPRPWPAGC